MLLPFVRFEYPIRYAPLASLSMQHVLQVHSRVMGSFILVRQVKGSISENRQEKSGERKNTKSIRCLVEG